MPLKTARASEQDLEVAQQISSFIEALEKGYMPEAAGSEAEFFDIDDPEQCQDVLRKLLEISAEGSIFRVTFGMLVVLDPANKILDPDAETLELHPQVALLQANAEMAAKKLRSAEICHPRAVMTLVDDARQILAPYLPAGWPETTQGAPA
jgi:hypothetical protein